MKNIFFTTLFLFASTVSAVSQINLHAAGKQSFIYSGEGITKEHPLKVWYYSPSEKTDSLPVLIMLHGAKRNASAYLDDWIATADLFHCIVVAPEFSQKDYPKAEKYNLGNVWNEKKKAFNDHSETTFSVIEPLFDFVKAQTGSVQKGYYLTGHSAGSQFVHRFLFFNPVNRVIRAVCANAGWYTMPNTEKDFPFGLKGAGVNADDLKSVFSKEVFIVLGEDDISANSEDFNSGPPYSEQGDSRYDRGLTFFETARLKAKAIGSPFNWKLYTVPHVAHSNKEISKFAAALFFMNMR